MQLSFESFDLKASIQGLIEQLQSISTCQLILKMDEPIYIKAHESYLIRALQNLITNAQRYGKDKIVIIVGQVNRQIQIRVEDDGIGLTDVQKQYVFEPFQVLEQSRNKKLAGHGLGLAIVKRIVLLHGGKAFVDEPVELSGASFVLVFPLRSI
ncbi:MAG: two-component sensor histidine kinase, partial [Saccharospirillaceae bacterium]|nr:ATP-binding protein [Pseudomonadales bacterium]NRB81939.1 two-component sensor histidine kinase [Saccharospirillaceae bacterium]